MWHDAWFVPPPRTRLKHCVPSPVLRVGAEGADPAALGCFEAAFAVGVGFFVAIVAAATEGVQPGVFLKAVQRLNLLRCPRRFDLFQQLVLVFFVPVATAAGEMPVLVNF